MASINLTGILRDPLGEFSYRNKIRFTHTTNTGQTLKGFRSIHDIEIDGAYDIDVEYGNVLIETWDYLNKKWIAHGVLTINSDTPASDIPSLLGITTPATEADLLVFQALVADATDAKNDAEAAQAATEALFTGFTDSVATELSNIAPGNLKPDVSIPFNEGIEIARGYGDLDANGNRSVTYTRASATGNTNKSGVNEDLLSNEPAITKNGLSVFASYSNDLLQSEDLSLWTAVNATVSQDGTTLPNSSELMWLVTEDTTAAVPHRMNRTYSSAAGDVVSATIKAKTNGSRLIRFEFARSGESAAVVEFDPNGDTINFIGAGVSAKYRSIGGSTYEFNIHFTTANVNTTSLCYFSAPTTAGGSSWDGDGVSGFYMTHAQITKNVLDAPYIKTTTVSVTRAADVAEIPMMGNMPPPGDDFTIFIDAKLDVDTISNKLAFGEKNFDATTGFRLETHNPSGNLRFIMSNGTSGIDLQVAHGKTGTYHRCACKFESGVMSSYVDGVLLGTIANATPTYTITKNISFSGLRVNSGLSNFEIYHRALSDEEIASRGGAK